MPLCANCERLYIPIVSSGQAFEGSELAPNIHALQLSAKTCQLCNLFCHSLESVKLKGIKNGALKLFSWGSDAQGDPIGLSRIFVRIGDHVGRFVDVFTEPGNHASKVGIAIGRKLSVEYNFDLYRQWLSDCLTIHHECANNKLADLPERFLEVTTSDGVDALRLVSHTQLDGHFAALSYCWGLPPFGVVTTTSSLKQHFNAINASKLSKTIQDAVQITRGLKIRYLWVDSLCIVQDDANDWRRESAKMEKVYQSAYVTIVAASAKGGSEGCLQLRRADIEPVNIQLTIPPSNELCILAFKLHSSSVSESFLSSPWNQRAWCLQEYALSRRILHFFSDRVVWQCKESFIAEDYAQLKPGRDQGDGAEPVISHPFSAFIAPQVWKCGSMLLRHIP